MESNWPIENVGVFVWQKRGSAAGSANANSSSSSYNLELSQPECWLQNVPHGK